MLQDIRFALRVLAKNPGFTAIAVLCLALGIGANSTIFSLVDGFWLRPLPVREPGGLVYLFSATDRNPLGSVSYPDYLEFRDRAKSLSGLMVTQRRGPTLIGDGFAESTMSNVVSEDYFTVLGVDAQVGRVFTERDRESDLVVVMSHNLWQRRFGGDPAIVGKTVRLGRAFTVVGIAPKGFRGVEPWVDSDFWIPMSSWDRWGERNDRQTHSFAAMGRLRPGATLEQARSEIQVIGRNLEQAYPQFNKGRRGVLYSALQYKMRNAGFTAGALMGIVGLVLLIACANVANLLLARAGARSHEIAVRLAIGARRPRLVRQLLTESGLIALLGAGAGLLLAMWLIQLLPSIVVAPGNTSTHYDFRMDARVLLFTLAVSLMTVLVFGLFPALRASRPDVAVVMRRDNSGARKLAGYIRPQGLLVIGQVALSMILLTGAGLLVRTFIHSLHTDLGFQRKSLLVAEVSPPYSGARAREFYRQLLERTRALPGVRQVAFAKRPPLWASEGGMAQGIEIPGRALPPGEGAPQVKFNVVDPNYFRTLGIRLARGRNFDERDGPDSPKIMIVSETMARRFWPEGDAIGKFVHASYDRAGVTREIVGVVADAHINSIQEEPEPYFYLPAAQGDWDLMLLAETTGDPLRLAGPLRSEVNAIERRAPVLQVSTLNLVIRYRMFEQQISATLVSALGSMGLFLAAIGLYGVLSYAVVHRTREIGIRMALGAQRNEALRMVLGHGLLLSAIGVAVGFAGALATTRFLEKVLFGVSPRDPLTFASVAALMILVALLASYVPARRATKVDPVVALRYE